MRKHDAVPSITTSGSRGLFFDVAAERFSEALQQRILGLARAASALPGVAEVVPGMNNLMLVYTPGKVSSKALADVLLDLWQNLEGSEVVGRDIEVPVIYGGAVGEDLPLLAEQAGLSRDEFVQRHSQAVYSVACLGAMAGFPYLSGLDPRLASPRRSVPRLRLEQGAVIIGGVQAGIMPCSAPSGWHVIGRTELALFDPFASTPALLHPGDRLHFTVAGLEA
ncbi:5-oxoprolinase subunit PxpB [Pseudomonas sp. R5(2019)]|uniref:5-oxoprolinase subunit PxpB n=1 Tax=Pseudomonas sp. R5(2019) TaxID=2697566 RepID=UPI0014126E73|nr:5-oxoprolinase subunit PxpB [Pseudomonas sp. R5(2019)]NBA94867.1 5-oxoprolinase subunit PxpB [Pseudomonas sp. R5(2019)]